MSLLSFDKVLKIISTILSILSYALGLLSDKPEQVRDDDQ